MIEQIIMQAQQSTDIDDIVELIEDIIDLINNAQQALNNGQSFMSVLSNLFSNTAILITTGVSATIFFIMLGVALFTLLRSIILFLIKLIARWRMFSKAGEPGWAAIVPILDEYVHCKVAFGSGWFFLIGYIFWLPFVLELFSFLPLIGVLIQLVNIILTSCGTIIIFIFKVLLVYRTSKVFGKSAAFAVGLWFLPIIFYLILAFGRSRYIPEEAGFFSTRAKKMAGNQQYYPNQGYPYQQGYPNPQQGYPNPQQGYPNPQQGYPNPQQGYPNQQYYPNPQQGQNQQYYPNPQQGQNQQYYPNPQQGQNPQGGQNNPGNGNF